jgi:hypothetical protein
MPKKLTIEEFIQKAVQKHGKKYDYSLVILINCQTKVKIICPVHGIFEQTPVMHLRGQGCPKCSLFKQKEFHKHPELHLKDCKCLHCTKLLTTEIFIKKATQKHCNKYNYSKVVYKGTHKKVCIICPTHGEFWQQPNNHLNGSGCPKCQYKKLPQNQPKTKEQFIKDAENIHGKNKYDYSLVKYEKNNKNIIIICLKHNQFKQLPTAHLNGSGCPKCKNSKGESIIRVWLENNNIKYETQKTFTGCVNKKKLRFDFYLPNFNMCIEFDGQQHFKEGINKSFVHGYKFTENDFKKNCHKDKIKNNFCKEHNIKLIRISYKKINKIEKILTKKLF